jgi:hypothetical protein
MKPRTYGLSLPLDSTLATARTGLREPVEYVRAVLEKLQACKRQYGEAQVRLGVRSGTESPNYRIEDFILDDGHRYAMPVAAYSGKTHRELTFESCGDYRNWASSATDIGDVRELIGELRNFKQKGPALLRPL